MIPLTPLGGVLLSVYLLLVVASPPVNQGLALVLVIAALVCFAIDLLRPYTARRLPPQ